MIRTCSPSSSSSSAVVVCAASVPPLTPRHFGCSCTSGTFVMPFSCGARAGGPTGATLLFEPENWWMSESGRACPPHLITTSQTQKASHLEGLGATQTGRTEGERLNAGVDMFPVCSTASSPLFSSPLLSVCVLLAAERQLGSRQKRSGLHLCFLRSLLLCIAVAASFRVMKQASTLLFSLFLIYLFIYLFI